MARQQSRHKDPSTAPPLFTWAHQLRMTAMPVTDLLPHLDDIAVYLILNGHFWSSCSVVVAGTRVMYTNRMAGILKMVLRLLLLLSTRDKLGIVRID